MRKIYKNEISVETPFGTLIAGVAAEGVAGIYTQLRVKSADGFSNCRPLTYAEYNEESDEIVACLYGQKGAQEYESLYPTTDAVIFDREDHKQAMGYTDDGKEETDAEICDLIGFGLAEDMRYVSHDGNQIVVQNVGNGKSYRLTIDRIED